MTDSAAPPERPTGEALFVRHLDTIERVIAFVCARNRLSGADADDFSSHVKLKFVENGYDVFAKFGGRSSLRTYLAVVIHRLFLDYRISAWGKWRPSAEAKRRGPEAMLLEQLMFKDGYRFEEACEVMTTNHGVTLSRAELEALAGSLPARVKRRLESDDALVDVQSSAPGADDAVADEERRQTAACLADVMPRLLEGFDMQDRLILTLRFVDGRSVADIALALRLEQKALYRRIDKLLARLRLSLEGQGIKRDAVIEMLESPSVNVEWGGAAGISTARPSIRTGARL